MPHYKNTQIGYVTGGAMAAATVGTYYALRAEEGGSGWLGPLLLGGFAVGTVLFASLTVVVDADSLEFYFGPGFWRRSIPLDDVLDVEVVRNNPLYGWGIRYTSHGWLYNVSGLQAVEVTARGEGTLRIGTDEPNELKRALETARQDGPERDA